MTIISKAFIYIGLGAFIVALCVILGYSLAFAQEPPDHPGIGEGECSTCHYTNESIHGPWTDTPDACARCHRTHSAVEDDLLTMPKDALCLFCHGSVGGLANTNVVEGVLRPSTEALRAGGFDYTIMNTSSSATAGNSTDPVDWMFPVISSPAPVTSEHTLGVEATIWGSWNASGVSDTDANAGDTNTILQCVSCHDPHAYGQTYRMLHREPEGSGINTHAPPNDTWNQFRFVTDQLTYARYNPGSNILSYATTDYVNTAYAAPNVLHQDTGAIIQVTNVLGTSPMYSQQINEWCASCHDRYHSPQTGHSAPGSQDSGDLIFSYQHKTGDATPTPTEIAGGTHDGAGNSTDLSDTTATFVTDGIVIGDIVENTADGSSAEITAVTETSITGALHGGTDNAWDTGDTYSVLSSTLYQSQSCGYSCHKNRELSCLGCHVAHGTSASMTGVVAAQPWPGEKYGASDVRDDSVSLGQEWLFQDMRAEFTGGTDHDGEIRSNLLRLDNRGVCQNPTCHPKGKNDYLNPNGDLFSIRGPAEGWNQYTSTGANVSVGSPHVTVEFDTVSATGYTNAIPLSGNPEGPTPGHFEVIGTFWEISTTATYSGPITICFSYEPSLVFSEADLQVFHWNGVEWVESTTFVDTVRNIICAQVTGLSPFFIGGQSASWKYDSCYKCHMYDSAHDAVSSDDCAYCHDSGFSGGCGSCHGAPPGTGAHEKHFGGNIGLASYGGTENLSDAGNYIFQCGSCHSTDSASHMNGTVDMEMYSPTAPAGSLKSLNPPTATYTPGGTIYTDDKGIQYTLGTCSDVYCHSRTDWSSPDTISQPLIDPLSGYAMLDEYGNLVYEPYTVTELKVYSTVNWGDPALDCNSCHRNNPQTVYPAVQAAVGNSHGWIDEWGYEDLHAWVHGYSPLICRTCHYDTVTDPMTWTRGSWDITYYDDVPIANKAYHVNGAKDVAFDPVNPVVLRSTWDVSSITYDPQTKICSSVPCHLNQPNPQWGGPYRWGWGSLECDQCHRYGGPWPPVVGGPWPADSGGSASPLTATSQSVGMPSINSGNSFQGGLSASSHPGDPAQDCLQCHNRHLDIP